MPETKQYGIIYADPPWHYDRKHGSGVAENHYPTMSIEEICALPVSELAAKDSALFLWATFPQLNEAFRVIDVWGFKYKTLAFLWLKQNRKADSWFYGMGFWTRSNAEVCLLATRGRPKRQCAGIHQFVISHIEQHSKKPDEVRDKIVKLMGDQPRVELFARQMTPGCDFDRTRCKAAAYGTAGRVFEGSCGYAGCTEHRQYLRVTGTFGTPLLSEG